MEGGNESNHERDNDVSVEGEEGEDEEDDEDDDDDGDGGHQGAAAAAMMLALVRGADGRSSSAAGGGGGGGGEEEDGDDRGDFEEEDVDDDDNTVPLAEVVDQDSGGGLGGDGDVVDGRHPQIDDDTIVIDDDDDLEHAVGVGGVENNKNDDAVLPASAPTAAIQSSIRLAGFADAASSPPKKRAWQLFPGWGVVEPKALAATGTRSGGEEEDDGGGTGDENDVEMKKDDVVLTTSENMVGGTLEEEYGEDNEITVTPAAGVIMDAIATMGGSDANGSPEAITVTLVDDINGEGDEEEEEKDDAEIDEVMRELRREDNKLEDHRFIDVDEGEGGDLITTTDPIEEAARRAAESLNREALLSTHESNYAAIQRERDALRRRLAERDADANERTVERDRLLSELEGARSALQQKKDEADAARAAISAERASHSETRAELTRAGERADRMDREADGLRAEISRLTRSNEEYGALLSSLTSQHSINSSEAMPLKLQVRRLEQELDALTSHSNYLDGELSNRNDVIASLKREHSREIRNLRSELDVARLTLERTEQDLTSARLINDQTSHDVENLQGRMRDAKLEHSSRCEMLERDLDKEMELSALKEQRALLAEDRCAALTREMAELKQLAREATEGATAQAEEIRAQWADAIDDAVRKAREEEGLKLVEVEERLRLATEAKDRMEEIIMDGGSSRRRTRMIESGGVNAGESTSPMPLLEDAAGGDGPLSLTDLYSRLADAEDDLRSEQRENQKLRIIIDRIQRDVAAKTPMIRQWQLEHESALEELDVANERLHYAQREVTDIRADNQELEILNGRLERECAELKRENVDLATQVQSLLQRRCAESAGDLVSFDNITSLQQQNQSLLRDHHSMTDKIAELEDKIRNDPNAIELTSLRSEVGYLREEREKQATLVAGIVHQRDLYRALVAKNDAPLVAHEGSGQDKLAFLDARAEQLPLIEARNHDLVEEVSKLKAKVSCCKHEQVALEGRLARVDAHANELTTSNERLRGELLTAKATVARLEIDISHYKGRTERLDNSLAMVKSECESESRRKTQTEELLSKTQAHLETVRGELAKKEQQYQQALSKMRLLEVQLETSAASEKRIESEAGALRVEIARQETLLSSVQRIEASLMAKAEGELEHLREELKRIEELKLDDATKHDAAVQKLEGKIADLETIVKDLTVQKDAATVSATKASLECSNLNLKVQELTIELKAAEKELKAAKIKLGDVTIDTSAEEALEAKVVSLTGELESTKVELAAAQTRIADYQAIAMSSEKQLADLTVASKKYKDETTATLKKLRQSEQSQCEAVAELTKDLMSYRGEKEKAVNELKATIDSLTSQLLGSKEDAVKAIAMSDSLTADARRYQLDAKNANVNYERELALHAEARAALRDARSEIESEQRLRKTIESQLASAQAEIEAEKLAWESSKARLEESLLEAKSRLDDMRTQNNMLHDQMAFLSATVDKIQSTKAAALMGNEPLGDSVDKADAPDAVRDKQLSDLRELLRFKQSECAMLEADLASAKRASERERTAADLANRSLEEARSELKVLRELDKDNVGGTSASEEEMCDLREKLNGAEEQLVLLRESNTMLREESHKVTKKLSEVQSQFDALKSSTASHTKMINTMEVERASLEAEKESLSREVEAWKNRVHNLVSKFNQIDPEDYAQALANVDQLKGECELLKSQKELSDANTAKAEGLVTRLSKEIESQKASIVAFKNALEKTKKEKEELSKTASSNKITNTKIAAAQATTKKAEEDLKESKAEVASLTSRLENFKKMMLKMQSGLKDAKAKEQKAKATEESLQKAISDLKEKLDSVNNATMAPSSSAATSTTQPVASSSTTANAQVNKDTEMAATLTEGAERNEIQVVEIVAETHYQEAPSAADPSTKTSASDTEKPTLNSETNAQSEANAEHAERTSDTCEKQGEMVSSDTDAAAAGKKKTRKRKANVPKKNAAPDLEVKIVEAPPQKKVATQLVAAKVETPSVSEAPSAVDIITTKVPPKAKTQIQAKKATSSVTKAKPGAESTNAPSQKELEMKMKLELLKKRKAAALAKKLEAEKQLAEKQSVPSSEIDGSDKLSESRNYESSTAIVDAVEMAKAEARKRRFAKPEGGEKERKDVRLNGGVGEVVDGMDESKPQAETTATLNQPLPSEKEVVEGAKTGTKESDLPNSENDPAPDDSSPSPMLFGSSSTLPMTFGAINVPPIQSEPDCPKPSFFGATSSTASNLVFGGAGPSISPFGGSSSPFALSTTPFGAAGAVVQSGGSMFQGGSSASRSGAFLNLTPPGVAGAGTTPGKFVFGKSDNIKLAVPAGGASPMASAKTLASFGKSGIFGAATPFGGPMSAFGSSPFGGGGGGGGAGGGLGGEAPSTKRPLTTPDEGEQPNAKQSRTEEEEEVEEKDEEFEESEDGEIHDEGAAQTNDTTNDAAAKEA